MRFLYDFFLEVFSEDYQKSIRFCRRHKLIVVISLCLIIYLFFDATKIHAITNPEILPIITRFLKRYLNYLFILFLFIWLLFLTFYFVKDGIISSGRFRDSFKDKNLRKWQFVGNWKVVKDENLCNVLEVTNSGTGGITKDGDKWVNYLFKFKTQIVEHNSTWIIRAQDINNYVMFQCGLKEINPHWKIDGNFIKDDPILLETPLKKYKWYEIEIFVQDFNVKIKIDGNTVFDNDYLVPKHGYIKIDDEKTRTILIDFPSGKIGFREHGNELSRFANVTVQPIK